MQGEDRSAGRDRSAVVQPAAITLPHAAKNPNIAALPLLLSRLASEPENPALLLTVARACQQDGRWDEALGYARRLDAIAPGAEVQELILDCLYRLGDADALDHLLPDALARGSELAMNVVALHLIKSRRFVDGFSLQHRLRHVHKSSGHDVGRDERIPWWDGQRFDGTLLLIAEQALGEEILTSGAITRIAGMGQKTVVECDARLIPLFRRSFPALDFVPRYTGALAAAVQDGCRKTCASELGYLLHRQDDFLNPERWLTSDETKRQALRAKYRERFGNRRLVGISWRSFRAGWGSRHKSLSLPDLATTLAVPDLAWISLQYGDVRDELAAAATSAPLWVDDAIDPTGNLDDLAAQIATLDLVVTTSNSTAHLAGALGVPVLLLLPIPLSVFPYWGYEGTRTSWYPSVHILRGTDDDHSFDIMTARTLSALLKQVPAR